jgi:hypothetical protein
MEMILKELEISGLTLHGDGRSSAPGIALPSATFHPDIALLYQRERSVAFEVKFLRQKGRQGSLSAAIGQATVYGSHGYEAVGIILLDTNPVRDEPDKIRKILKGLEMQSCIFCKSGTKLYSM